MRSRLLYWIRLCSTIEWELFIKFMRYFLLFIILNIVTSLVICFLFLFVISLNLGCLWSEFIYFCINLIFLCLVFIILLTIQVLLFEYWFLFVWVQFFSIIRFTLVKVILDLVFRIIKAISIRVLYFLIIFDLNNSWLWYCFIIWMAYRLNEWMIL